ncbi:MAG: Hsp20/alpha crystallin family protein [Phycisphaerales bacterium]|nr:Hsp20/alpha crystallin family protein [Phycisphaerales bacterium]
MMTRRMTRMFPELSLMPPVGSFVDAMLRMPGHETPDVHAVFPPLNVLETDEVFIVEAELPGYTMGDLEISMLDGELSIIGRREEKLPENVVLHRRERAGSAEFKRVLKLNVPVASERVSAKLESGVLTIELPKAEAAKPRRIEIKIA